MNLSDAYRYFRKGHMPGGRAYFFAHAALERAREAVAKHAAARAHYETCAALKDSDPSPENVAAYQAALKASAASRLYVPESPCVSYQPDATGAAARRGERLAHVSDPEAFGLRHVGNVEAESHGGRNAFSNRDSCGWYTDPHGDVFKDGTGLVWGVVYQLPAHKGRARFVAGYQFGGVDGGPTLDLGNVYTSESMRGEECAPQDHDDARDAARAADSMAERAAESEREYQTAWALGNVYREALDDAREARQEALEAIGQFKAARSALATGDAMPGKPEGATPESRYGRLCALIRSDVSDLLERIRDARDTARKALEGDGPHGLCVYMGETERAAFCDAAGLDSFPA